ncbi:hypothetical protein MOQ72_17665 [Saccharopolyspora sp. K220]|nr:hypothetical protein [Saccharopolyspora soli]MCI2419276.1 hypothetical protein [Saccharopolyspora soli]
MIDDPAEISLQLGDPPIPVPQHLRSVEAEGHRTFHLRAEPDPAGD